MRLLARDRDAKGVHDDLLSHGSLPVSVLEWIMLDDPTDLEKATGLTLH